MKSSEAWKNLERHVAKVMGGIRVLRGSDFSVKDVDVKICDFPNLIVDAKYRKQSWGHHRFLDEIREKYCASPEEVPVLVTKNHRQRGAVVSLPLKDFGEMLWLIRSLRKGS